MKISIFFVPLVVGAVLLSCGCTEPNPITACPNGTVEISATNNYPQGDFRYAKLCGCITPEEAKKYENLIKIILDR